MTTERCCVPRAADCDRNAWSLPRRSLRYCVKRRSACSVEPQRPTATHTPPDIRTEILHIHCVFSPPDSPAGSILPWPRRVLETLRLRNEHLPDVNKVCPPLNPGLLDPKAQASRFLTMCHKAVIGTGTKYPHEVKGEIIGDEAIGGGRSSQRFTRGSEVRRVASRGENGTCQGAHR